MLKFIMDCICGGTGLLLLFYSCSRAISAAIESELRWIWIDPVNIVINIVAASVGIFLLSNFAMQFAILWTYWD